MNLDYPTNESTLSNNQTHRKPSLIKSDSIDVVDCKFFEIIIIMMIFLIAKTNHLLLLIFI